MIVFDIVQSKNDLLQILELQKKNLAEALPPEEVLSQGFVTVVHDLPLLQKMNEPFPHIVVRCESQIIGYALVMLRDLEKDIPVLIPMFEQMNKIEYQGQLLKDYKYFVMGQICIAKSFRGQGLFQGLYSEMSQRMYRHFDFIITEVSPKNTRSMRAHHKAGFHDVLAYTAAAGEDWVILLLDIRASKK